MNLNPAPLGLIKRKGKEDEIFINSSQVGNTYLKALTKSMKHLDPKDVKIFNVKENEQGIIDIVDNLKKGCETLDLKDCTLGMDAIQKLCEWMDTQATYGCLSLKNLIVSNSNLGDRTGARLIDGLRLTNPDLRELDLSQNKIGDRICKSLGEFLGNAYFINKLNLKWNNISSKGAIYLFDGLKKGRC